MRESTRPNPAVLHRAETTDGRYFTQNDPNAKVNLVKNSFLDSNNHISSGTQVYAAAAANSVLNRSESWNSLPAISHTHDPASNHTIDKKTKGKLKKEIAHTVKVIETFFTPKVLNDAIISQELLVEAYGLVFLTVYKLGFLFSGKVGKGFIISRTAGGWSAPSFICSGGMGFGMMAGGEVVNYMIILNSRSAVKVFTRQGQFQVGSELDLAVGPIGRAASASLNVGRGGIAPNYSYSHCKGLYGGIGLTSAVLATRKSMNAKCYGPNVTARQILGGEVSSTWAVPLWKALDKVLGADRRYVNGFPVALNAGGTQCESCGFQNLPEHHKCERCQKYLVYSVSVHSGRRHTSRLVVSNSQEM